MELIGKLEALAQRPVTPAEGEMARAKADELRSQLPSAEAHQLRFGYTAEDWWRLAGFPAGTQGVRA